MRFATILLTLAGIFIALESSHAQCRTIGHSYVSNSYVAPYVNSYYQPVIPVAVPTFLIPNTYYSIEPDLAATRIQQQIAEEAADRALAKLMNLLRQQQGTVPGAPTAPSAPGTGPGTTLPGTGPIGTGPHEHPSSLTTKVQTMVTARCAACHHDGTNKLDLRDVSRLGPVEANKMVLRTTLNSDDPGFMPKSTGGKTTPITQQEYDDLAHWAFEVNKHGAGVSIKQPTPVAPPTPKATDPKIPPAVPDAKPPVQDAKKN